MTVCHSLCIVVLLALAVSAVPRIIGGEDAVEGQFPYQVSYQIGFTVVFEHVCGGAIVAPSWVVVAGRCITQSPSVPGARIVAGVINVGDRTENRQEVAVVEKIVHSEFLGSNGPHDIALLRLERPLEFNEFVGAVQLPTENGVVLGEAVFSGWSSDTRALKTTLFNIIENAECKNVIDAILNGDANPYSEECNVCTTFSEAASLCTGDSGNPLVQDGTLVGLASWTIHNQPCGAEGVPAIFTKIGNYIDFVNEHITN